MFYNGELENEMRLSPDRIMWRFQVDDDREKYLREITSENKTYKHAPSDGCKKRGKQLWSACG